MTDSKPQSSSRDLVENILDAGLPPDEVALEVSCEEIVSLAQDYRDLEEQLEATRSALQALVDYADGKVGDDFGTTEWARAREALKDA